MSNVTDWISAAANVTVAASVVFVAKQAVAAVQQAKSAADSVREAKKDREEDHIRSRRQSAVDLLHKWRDSITMSQTCAMYVVNSLDKDAARDFKLCQPVKVSSKQARNLKIATANAPDLEAAATQGDFLCLDVATVLHVGSECKRYIDLLEVILIGWRYGTADREILEEQLSALIKPDDNLLLASNFRNALGHQNYPNIEQFVQHISAHKTGAPLKKPLLGS